MRRRDFGAATAGSTVRGALQGLRGGQRTGRAAAASAVAAAVGGLPDRSELTAASFTDLWLRAGSAVGGPVRPSRTLPHSIARLTVAPTRDPAWIFQVALARGPR